MFEAQTLMADSLVEVFTPWFPRGGDHARFMVDVVSLGQSGGGVPEITVRIWTKNTEQTGEGADADATVSIVRTAAGRTTAEWVSTSTTGLKELVRYKFAVANTLDLGTVWVLFRMLTPVWFNGVRG